MSVTVTHAQPSDLDALAVLFDAYRQFYGQPSDVAAAREWLRSRLWLSTRRCDDQRLWLRNRS